MKTPLILGATGKVGQPLVAQALVHPQVGQVFAPTRRPLPPNPQLTKPIIDYQALPTAPCMLTEVLNRREKLLAYQKLPSLREYLLIAQDRMQVEIFHRVNLREWG